MDIEYHQELKNNDSEYKNGLSKDIDYINENKKNQVYHEFLSEHEEEAFTQGFVYNKNIKYYLCASSMHGEIKFWDLENKKFDKKISCGKDYNLLSIIQWSEKYIIFADNNNSKSFKILDMDEMQIISNVGGKHHNPITCIKKINHSLYGKCIITSGNDNLIIIWSLK